MASEHRHVSCRVGSPRAAGRGPQLRTSLWQASVVALALTVGGPAAALAEVRVGPSVDAVGECGEVTLVFDNPTSDVYQFDYRVDGEPVVSSDGQGNLWNVVSVDGGESTTETVTFDEDSGDHLVEYRVARGPDPNLHNPEMWWTAVVPSDCVTSTPIASPTGGAVGTPSPNQGGPGAGEPTDGDATGPPPSGTPAPTPSGTPSNTPSGTLTSTSSAAPAESTDDASAEAVGTGAENDPAGLSAGRIVLLVLAVVVLAAAGVAVRTIRAKRSTDE